MTEINTWSKGEIVEEIIITDENGKKTSRVRRILYNNRCVACKVEQDIYLKALFQIVGGQEDDEEDDERDQEGDERNQTAQEGGVHSKGVRDTHIVEYDDEEAEDIVRKPVRRPVLFMYGPGVRYDETGFYDGSSCNNSCYNEETSN